MSFPRYPKYKDSGVEWLGTVPAHWQTSRLKNLFALMNRLPEAQDGIVTAFRDGEVTLRNNRRVDGFTNAIQEHGYQRILKGDLVIHAMDAFAGAIGVSDSDGKSSPVYSVCTPKSPLVHPPYYGRLLRHMAMTGYINALSKGIRERSTEFRWKEASNVIVSAPSLAEQTQIVAFLDRETAKIDELVAEQRRLMELLKEKRQAVISHAVTQGLKPDAPMKPSGIEWLGDVPAHWEIQRISRLAKPGTSITYGIVQAGPDFEGGIPYIRTSDMSEDAFQEFGYMKTSPEIDASYSRSKVCTGDLVVAIRATLGKGLLVPAFLDGANLTQGTAKISPGDRLDSKFLSYAFNSAYCQIHIDRVAKGSTFREITLDALRRIPLALPPRSEQEEIVANLQNALLKFANLVADAQRAIDLLLERRTALISAAVTGQIDVRALTERKAA